MQFNVFLFALIFCPCEENKCVIIVTHAENVTAIADEVIEIRAGRLLSGEEYHALITGVLNDVV
jgi:ABC-type lipoprotein export system ATPase subunit